VAKQKTKVGMKGLPREEGERICPKRTKNPSGEKRGFAVGAGEQNGIFSSELQRAQRSNVM